MLIAILQAVLTAVAGYGLWRFLRALDGRGIASRIITAGFLVRALGAQILFWISWLRLPIARSLQVGDGFWFFAIDGQWYVAYTRELLHKGLKAIVFINGMYPSHSFTQWLTIFAGAFGSVASTAILFNCVAYLATSALILRIAPPQAERARAFALAAVAFGPATILWSMQPLKDTFFLLLIAAILAVCDQWQRLWREAAPHARRSIVLCTLAFPALLYGISGTRWYVGAIVGCASLVFFALVALLPRPRLAAGLLAALLLPLFAGAFLLGGDFDIPITVRNVLDPHNLIHPRTETETVADFLRTTRRGFETTPGGTTIAPGSALLASAVPQVKPQAPPPAPAAATPEPLPIEKSNRVTAAELRPEPQKKAPAIAKPQPAVAKPAPAITMPEPVVVANAQPTRTIAPSVQPPAPLPVTQASAMSAPPVSTAPAPAPPPVTKASAMRVPPVSTATVPPPVAPRRDGAFSPPGGMNPAPRRHATPKHVTIATRTEVHAATTLPAPKPAPPAVIVAPRPTAFATKVPQPTIVAKLVTGAAAMFIPRAIGQAAGLVRIGGGRGFWLFADADTLVFDGVVFFAFGYSLLRIARRKKGITPLFILVVLVFVAMAGPMMYSVTNFGTLFRLRQMLYILAAMLPLTLDLREPAR